MQGINWIDERDGVQRQICDLGIKSNRSNARTHIQVEKAWGVPYGSIFKRSVTTSKLHWRKDEGSNKRSGRERTRMG
jgi:hypothetical protein